MYVVKPRCFVPGRKQEECAWGQNQPSVHAKGSRKSARAAILPAPNESSSARREVTPRGFKLSVAKNSNLHAQSLRCKVLPCLPLKT